MPARIILLDIEGTTTPIRFVYDVLFPFARTHVVSFLSRHLDEESSGLSDALLSLAAENDKDRKKGLNPPVIDSGGDLQSIAAYFLWLMDEDRKSTPLKLLQGRIWEEGYRRGELSSEVFDDVPRAFERWAKQGKLICIYSSGSVLAQQLLFSHTRVGDLTSYIADYFDTDVGAKSESESYRRIAAAFECEPARILFVSDIVSELDAAGAAGCETILCIRKGNRPQPAGPEQKRLESFDELYP